MLDRFFTIITNIFDALHVFIESDKTMRRVTGFIIFIFISSLIAIELKRRGLLPDFLTYYFTSNHFQAVSIAFTLLLILEVVSLIFIIPCSTSKALAKQFEIMALILLRNAFKELTLFPEPISIINNMDGVYRIAVDGFGALAIFTLLGISYKINPKPIAKIRGYARFSLVAAKKTLALMLLLCFTSMGIFSIYQNIFLQTHFDFFKGFYTILIFNDILLVFIVQRYLPDFATTFRNSGYALATLLIRLALTAPPYWNAIISIASITFALCLTLVYKHFFLPQQKIIRQKAPSSIIISPTK